MSILLDNAQKYSKEAGRTNVTLARRNNRCLLCVANEGEPLCAADLKNIFRRFYRVDQARVGDGSFGLGLSIAQSIVQRHKGRIWAESKAQVNTFFVELPLS